MTPCRRCSAEFSQTPREKELRLRLAPKINEITFPLPEPTLCPVCRLQSRLAWRGELNLFHRKCGSTGNSQITFYPPEAPCTVYSPEAYWSDSWDPRSKGKEYDFSRPFFEQFAELLGVAPVIALTNSNNQNNQYPL